MVFTRRVCAGLAAAVLLVFLLTVAAAAGQGSMVLYVSPSGKDTFSGRLAEPDGQGDGPFATLGRARDAIRRLKAEGKADGLVTVLVREGTYRLRETFVLEPQDSGTKGAPVTFAAYPGETPVLSGGRPLTGWHRVEGKRWEVRLPDVAAGRWHFRQLFVGGGRRPRARMPNEGWFRMTGLVKPKPRKDPINRRAFHFKPGDIRADWINLGHVEILKLFGWSETRRPIAKVDEAEHIVHVAGPCSGSERRPFDWYGPRYVVENVLEGLDQPGEWYLDPKTGVLSYLPMPGEDWRQTEVVAPALDCLVRLDGDAAAGAFVQHVTFRDLAFLHGGAAWPEGGYEERQSDVFVPGAIQGTGVRHCRFEGNTVAHVGTYAIELLAGSRHNAIVHNHLHDLGAGGVKVDGPLKPATPDEETSHAVITDNRIHDGGHIYLGGTGIWVGHSGHNTICHNAVHDLYGMGISIGWTWRYVLTPAHHNVVEYNHVYDLGHGKVGASSGLYTLARQPGTVLRYNLVHDIVKYTDGPTHPTFGIQVDNGSGEMLFEKNVVYNVPDACWKQFGKEHVVRNNIFAFADGYEILRRKDEGTVVLTRNIVLSDDGLFYGDSWKTQNFEADHNLYWDTSNEPQDFGGQSFKAWQVAGHDRHSRFADPKFRDPANGDFRLPADSPAHEIGFEPIDLSTVGPRKRTAGK